MIKKWISHKDLIVTTIYIAFILYLYFARFVPANDLLVYQMIYQVVIILILIPMTIFFKMLTKAITRAILSKEYIEYRSDMAILTIPIIFVAMVIVSIRMTFVEYFSLFLFIPVLSCLLISSLFSIIELSDNFQQS